MFYKFLKRCQTQEGIIKLKEKTFYLESEFYKKELKYNDIDIVLYGIDERGYYFRFHEKNSISNEIYASIKENIRYRIENNTELVKRLHAFGVKILPDFGQYGISCDAIQNNFVDYCQNHKNSILAVLSITKDFRNKIYCINACNYTKEKCKIIDLKNIDIEHEFHMENLKKCIFQKRYTFKGVYVLNKWFTFGQGYCIVYLDYPNNKGVPIVLPKSNFFYSHDKDEIKAKILEFFEKFNHREYRR